MILNIYLTILFFECLFAKQLKRKVLDF